MACAFLVLPVLVFAKDNVQKTTAANLDKIIVVVNGDVITKNELNKRMVMIRRQLTANHIAVPQDSVMRKQALDDLIDNLLQLQLAQRNGVKVSDAELNGIISNIVKSNNFTMEQFKKTLQEQEGMSFKEYREQMREQILINRVEQRFLGGDIVVTDKEIAKVLRNPPKLSNAVAQYHVVDILVAVSDDVDNNKSKAATAVAKKIIATLKKGEDVAKIVQKYNSSKQQVSSNDLGWRKADELPTIFAPEVTKLKTGQIAGPIQAPNGLHLLKLLGMQGLSPQGAKFTKEQAQEMVYRQKLEKKLKSWLQELRDTAYIKIMN